MTTWGLGRYGKLPSDLRSAGARGLSDGPRLIRPTGETCRSPRHMNQIVTELLNALDEYTASCTVVIASTNAEVPHGSGVAVKYGGEHYILTAAHVLRNEPDNEKIRVIGKPDGPLQLLRGKKELVDAIANRSHVPVFSSATPISITGRLSHDGDDIAAIKVQNPNTVLRLTNFHDLSGQGETKISVDGGVTIFGFPGELAKHYEHTTTGRRGWAAFPHVTVQTIKEIADAPEVLNPGVDLITDFDYPEEECDPHGMSGCGAWSIPKPQKGEIWSASKSQLLGIQIGHYMPSKLLRFVRIERVLGLFSGAP